MIDFLKELTRRKVWFFGGIYLALGWIMLQVSIAVEATMELPNWIDQSVLVLLVVGFPFALLLAWAQESRASAAGDVDPVAEEPSEERRGFSVAVLPFDDLSSDGSLQELSDGVPEDIITQLSFNRSLRVSARNSSFAFKGTSPDIRDVGRQLSVRFVLEGSFRKVGENTRITAQLIEALTGDHVWSDNFDRSLERLDKEIDEVVDEIVDEVITAIRSREQTRLMARDPADLSVLDLGSLAQFHIVDAGLEKLRESEALMEVALVKAPADGNTNALVAQIQSQLAFVDFGNRSEHRRRAHEHLAKAKSAGTPDIEALISMALGVIKGSGIWWTIRPLWVKKRLFQPQDQADGKAISTSVCSYSHPHTRER